MASPVSTPAVDLAAAPAGDGEATPRSPGLIADLFALTKPRLSTLVLITAGGGVWLADRNVSAATALAAVLGTTMVVGGANTLNCYLERELDRRMLRTRGRPLPSGRVRPNTALAFGVALSLISVPLLTLATTPLAGLLAAVALVLYVMVYTPMKRTTSLSTLVGAVPGALPPLIGWTAVTGRLDMGGLLLFLLLFLWQIPHSLAIGIYRASDYEKAGMVVFPNEFGLAATRRQALLYTVPLVATPLFLAHAGVAGIVTMTVGAVLGLWFLWLAFDGFRRQLGPRWARRFFLASLVYLTALFGALSVDQLV